VLGRSFPSPIANHFSRKRRNAEIADNAGNEKR
jgi:hypothetical protein